MHALPEVEWPDDIQKMVDDPGTRAGDIYHEVIISKPNTLSKLPLMAKAVALDIDKFHQEMYDKEPMQVDYAKDLLGALCHDWWRNAGAVRKGDVRSLNWFSFAYRDNDEFRTILDDDDLMQSRRKMTAANGSVVDPKMYDGCMVFRSGAFDFYLRIHRSKAGTLETECAPKIAKIIARYYELSENKDVFTRLVEVGGLIRELNAVFQEHFRMNVLDLIVDNERNDILYQAGYRVALQAAMRGRWMPDVTNYSRKHDNRNWFTNDPVKRELTARETLLKLLGREKYDECLQKGRLHVKAKSGKIYVIKPGYSFVNVYERGKLLGNICIQLSGDWPETDSLIMRYLLLLNDEERLYDQGVWTKAGEDPSFFDRDSGEVELTPLTELLTNLKQLAHVA